jgi:hypothetical protein
MSIVRPLRAARSSNTAIEPHDPVPRPAEHPWSATDVGVGDETGRSPGPPQPLATTNDAEMMRAAEDIADDHTGERERLIRNRHENVETPANSPWPRPLRCLGSDSPRIGYDVDVQKSRPTQNKRARERARQERQQMKAARRLEAKQRKASAPDSPTGEDPDIAGIVPGPQPSPWGDE